MHLSKPNPMSGQLLDGSRRSPTCRVVKFKVLMMVTDLVYLVDMGLVVAPRLTKRSQRDANP